MSQSSDLLIRYSGYLIGFLGFAYGLIQWILKNRAEMKAKSREMKYQIYKEYLIKLERINNKLNREFNDDFLKKVTLDTYNKIVTTPEQSENALIEMQKSLSELMSNIYLDYNSALEELTGLRIVCNKTILKYLDEYEQVFRDLSENTIKALESLDFTRINSIHNQLPLNIEASGKRIESLKTLIENEIRKDIGF